MGDTLRLKGKRYTWIESGSLEFECGDVVSIDCETGGWNVSFGWDIKTIDPATIQLADDPRRQLLDEIKGAIYSLKAPNSIKILETEVSESDSCHWVNVAKDAQHEFELVYLEDVIAAINKIEAKL